MKKVLLVAVIAMFGLGLLGCSNEKKIDDGNGNVIEYDDDGNIKVESEDGTEIEMGEDGIDLDASDGTSINMGDEGIDVDTDDYDVEL